MAEESIYKHSLLISALLFALTAASVGAVLGEAGGTTRTAQVGKSYTLQLNGTPGTGYTWQYNAANSVNVSIIDVTSLGYGRPARGTIGGAASYAFRITPLSPGRAKLVFDYVRPWEGTPVRQQEHRIVVQP